jgi:hypothetical protein
MSSGCGAASPTCGTRGGFKRRAFAFPKRTATLLPGDPPETVRLACRLLAHRAKIVLQLCDESMAEPASPAIHTSSKVKTHRSTFPTQASR